MPPTVANLEFIMSSNNPLGLFFYQNGYLVLEISDTTTHTFLRHQDIPLAQAFKNEASSQAMPLIADPYNSILRTFEEEPVAVTYTPYGHSPEPEARQLLGFNGQRRSIVTGHYILGNGYRLYSPHLNRFCSPDSWSPFGNGGCNAYAYCGGDPINRTDPSGHMYRWQSGIIHNARGRQPAGIQLIGNAPLNRRRGSTASSTVSSSESLNSNASSRSRSRSPLNRERNPHETSMQRRSSVGSNASTATAPLQTWSRRDSSSSTDSGTTVNEAGVPLDFMFDSNDRIGRDVLSHMASHTNVPSDKEIFFRFNNPSTTVGMPTGVELLELNSPSHTIERINMARINQLKRQSRV
ncbi:RHS repeat-associated core domain-containing protein [Pseudomonas putida]|uniref:RHS repeat-associated core domain-containing protein n=1 Tax=Pseudomonas putida TaxID=303 RepID=UPI0039AF5E48